MPEQGESAQQDRRGPLAAEGSRRERGPRECFEMGEISDLWFPYGKQG